MNVPKYMVIVTCTCVDTNETSHFTREIEDIQALWEKEQMQKFHCAGTSGNLIPQLDVWSTTGTALLNGGYSYIKTWSQYKLRPEV